MHKPKRSCLGDCLLRKIKVENTQVCDYFDAKKKPLKPCCKNCKHFKEIKIDVQKIDNTNDV